MTPKNRVRKTLEDAELNGARESCKRVLRYDGNSERRTDAHDRAKDG